MVNLADRYTAKGNKKLPKTTWIFNSGTATNCPSRKLGLCQCSDKCYAMKAERQYKNVLPYRQAQTEVTREVDAADFAGMLLIASKRKRVNILNKFRFNESGDFYSQKQLNWFAALCGKLKRAGIVSYGYTARTDLDLTLLIKNAFVNVSNDLNKWTDTGANRFKAVKAYTDKNLKCAGDCRICSICSKAKGKTIEVEIH